MHTSVVSATILLCSDDNKQSNNNNNGNMTSNAVEDEKELLSRLTSQFGDMDLSNLLNDGNNDGKDDDAESEESSLMEPSAEELRAWQQAQFSAGKAKKQQQKKLTRLQQHRQTDDEWEHVPALPDLQGKSSIFLTTPALQHQLVHEDPGILSAAWQCLYSSQQGDGLSYARLRHCIDGYDGPSVTMFSTGAATTIGLYLATSWQSTKQCAKTNDCFVFTIRDGILQVFPSTHLDHELVRCTHDDGIRIGGMHNQSRIHITETLEDCRALPFCGTFRDGDLLPMRDDSLYYFDVDAIEVWGVGGIEWIQHALDMQQRDRAAVQARRNNNLLHEKKQLLEDFRSGLFSSKYVRCDVE